MYFSSPLQTRVFKCHKHRILGWLNLIMQITNPLHNRLRIFYPLPTHNVWRTFACVQWTRSTDPRLFTGQMLWNDYRKAGAYDWRSKTRDSRLWRPGNEWRGKYAAKLPSFYAELYRIHIRFPLSCFVHYIIHQITILTRQRNHLLI